MPQTCAPAAHAPTAIRLIRAVAGLQRRRHSLLRGWHCDHGACVDPPAATILCAETVLPYGGNTTWSNLAAAYAGSSAPVREFVDGLGVDGRPSEPIIGSEPGRW